MKRVAFLVALVCVTSASAAGVDTSRFRWTRTLTAPPGRSAIFIEPDEALLGHSRRPLADLRVVDAQGAAVAWRPGTREAPERAVGILDVGRRNARSVALLDLGANPGVHDRVALDLPDERYVGRVTVAGSDHRNGPWTTLGTTTVYDVRGAQWARSTIVRFRPSDYRYLQLVGAGVPLVDGASVPPADQRALIFRPARTSSRTTGRRTVVTLDFRYPHIPVSEFHAVSRTRDFDRFVTVLDSDDGRSFQTRGTGRLIQYAGSALPFLQASTDARYVRLVIDNGDDRPLQDLSVNAYDVSRGIFVQGTQALPYSLYYGARLRFPEYDFARLPLDRDRVRHGRLGPEEANAAFRAAPDTRSFFAKHDWLVKLALAVGALVVAGAGLAALRRT